MSSNGFINLDVKCSYEFEANEHGLFHSSNKEFYNALLDLLDLLRVETLCRECHPIHEKIVELNSFIKKEYCQDFTPSIFPILLLS